MKAYRYKIFTLLGPLILFTACSNHKRVDLSAPSVQNTIELSDVQEDNLSFDSSELSIDEQLIQKSLYKIEEGETLMLISFKIYGDYSRWREIKKLNPKSSFKAGELINYQMPDEVFTWEPLGEQYLVRNKDTLQIISRKLYDTTRKWPELFQNNRPLLKDPDKIYVGFTIFYIPDTKRSISSE